MADSQMAQYMRRLQDAGYGTFSTYADLHQWSVTEIEKFWESIWKWSGVVFQAPFTSVLEKRVMPGAKWFSGARLNFAMNLLAPLDRLSDDKIAITAISESGAKRVMSYSELYSQVTSFAKFLKTRGVKAGDRVAAMTSNTPEPIVAMLATTSLGAIWSSCSPEFGAQGVLDRFGQISPKVLLAVDGYHYGGKTFSCESKIQWIRKQIPSIQTLVLIPQLETETSHSDDDSYLWKDIVHRDALEDLSFASLAFDHPVYILYSSGTTGTPKCIVQGAGGVLLQHAKEHRLHTNLTSQDKFFYFTTLSWMMWNWMVSGLMTGCELILYDGSPTYPSVDRLWKLIDDEGITIFGTSAKFLSMCRTQKLKPKSVQNLNSLKTVLSTGSPLAPEDFDWVYANVKNDVWLASISGGTDIVSCFVLGNPMLPVIRGEIQCKGLGMAVKAYSEDGSERIDEEGELVCTEPAPSMPVSFWNDPDGSKYQKAYFERFPGIWWHGDYIKFTRHGSAIISGRSDATLNPGGVRIGTAEIYRQVEAIPEVKDSLAVGQPWQGDERIILFVVLREGELLTQDLEKKIRDQIREGTTPKHVPSKIIRIQEVPYTFSGKKVEVAVKKILRGEKVENRETLANPEALDQFTSQIDP